MSEATVGCHSYGASEGGGVDSNHFHWLLETAFLSTTLFVGEVKGRARQAMLSKSGLGKSGLLKWSRSQAELSEDGGRAA